MMQILRAMIVIGGLALSGLAGLGPGQAARAAERDGAIEAVIAAQIEAFRAGDFAAAFRHASPAIQRQFGAPQGFEAMVRQGYRVLINPVDMQFLGLREDGGALWQRVLYRDLHGEVYFYDYEMVRGPDGAWRINAVRRVAMPQVSS